MNLHFLSFISIKIAQVLEIKVTVKSLDIKRSLAGNKLADHPDVVGAIACRRCFNYIFILNLTPGFNGLGKDNFKMSQESFKFCFLVQLILEIWW